MPPRPAPPRPASEIFERLLPGLKHLHGALDAKAQEFTNIIKVRRLCNGFFW